MYFLNDKNEFELGLKLFVEEIERHQESSYDLLKPVGNYLSALEESIEFIKEKESPYILSLTKNRDLLSQWRGYTDNGVGVNIGFNKEFFEQSNLKVFPCVYDKKIQKDFVYYIVNQSMYLFIAICDEMRLVGDNKKENIKVEEINEAITIAGSHFIDRAILACSLIKDVTFCEEEEWRVLFVNNKKEVSFQTMKNYLKPFVKIKLNNLSSIIELITIGPNSEKELCALSIKKLLQTKLVDNVKIEHSLIPYRN
jgi:hypothetical protein